MSSIYSRSFTRKLVAIIEKPVRQNARKKSNTKTQKNGAKTTQSTTTATAQRTLNVMKQLKTHVHNSLSQRKLNHLLLLNVSKDEMGK